MTPLFVAVGSSCTVINWRESVLALTNLTLFFRKVVRMFLLTTVLFFGKIIDTLFYISLIVNNTNLIMHFL